MILRHPRYCDVSFPPYRFIPGTAPHPVAHPAGHSYRPPGEPEPQVACVAPDRWRDSVDYLYGCDLYNHGYWWEAHEAWEGLWRVTAKPSVQHSFLQGLIQVAAAHMQVHLGKIEGVRRLRESSRRHLAPALDVAGHGLYMGVSLAAWVSGLDAYWAGILSSPEIAHREANYPYLSLRTGEDDNS
ncbi:MAG TPA: DUF309 domain-containing protein [Phycisphaerae bacterium]|nr:DUF309 domain-containing protein [Phycisphaerae bacterium]HRW55876.1 DUF309 domain-containing protein [Phycisphaerae bacterium]